MWSDLRQLFALLLSGHSIGVLDGQVWLDAEQVGEGGTLLVGELAAEAVGVQDGLSLLGWHLAQVAYTLSLHDALPI